ncbi:hypothetical protein ACFLQW_01220 [Candidatus Zixiibacteriota bacterium]
MRSSVIFVTLVLAIALTAGVADAEQKGQIRGRCVATLWECEKCGEYVSRECIVKTTVFNDVGIGDTVTIEIVSANGNLAPGDPVSIGEVIPKPKTNTAVISQTRLSDKKVAVTLKSCSASAETVHLNVSLDTGEEVAVTLKLHNKSMLMSKGQ